MVTSYASIFKLKMTFQKIQCQRSRPIKKQLVLQQDGASSLTNGRTQGHLGEATPEFIKKAEWPPQT